MSITPYTPPKPRKKNQPIEPIQISLPAHFKDEALYWKDHCTTLETKLKGLQREYDELKHLKIIADSLTLDCFKSAKKVNIFECSRNIKQNTCKGCINRTQYLRKIC